MKRNLWIALAAALMLVVLWCGVALADDYAFRTQPRNITLDPENETTLRWSLTFNPVRTELVLYANYYGGYSSDHTIPVKEIGSNSFHCTLTYEEAREALREVPAGVSCTWYLDAYVYENRKVRSDPINITLNPYAFTLQPSGGSLAPEGTLHLSWRTNFTPEEIRINYVKEQNFFSESIVVTLKSPAASSTSADLSYGEVVTFLQNHHAAPDEDKWFIQAFYDDDQYVASDYFSVPVEDLRFRMQPQGGTLESGQDLTLNWATNFTPTWSEVVYAYGWTDSGFAHTVQVKKVMNSGCTCDLSYNEVNAALSDIPYYSYIDSEWMVVSHYNYQSDLQVSSKAFDISFTGPQFTSLTDEGYDPDSLKCTVTWDTNFTPNWWELENVTTGVRERLNDTGTGHNWYELDTDTIGQEFRVRAYYGQMEDQYIASAKFSGNTDRLNFTVQPKDCWMGNGTTAEITWATSFAPVRVELKCFRTRYIGSPGATEVFPVETDSFELKGKWGNAAFQPLEREWISFSRTYATDSYYLCVYYTENEYAVSRYFSCLEGSPRFTRQPENVVYQPGYGADVICESNFSPQKTRLALVDTAGNPLPEDPEDPFTFYRTGEHGEIIAVFLHEGTDSCDLRVLLWYDMEKDPIVSDVFTVSRYAFTTQPMSGYIQRRAEDEQHTPMYSVSWETSFEPVSVQICSVDEEGEAEPEGICAILCPEATDKTFEIPMTEAVGDLRSFRIRASYGTGANEFVSSKVFTVTDPLVISADPVVYVEEEEGGVLRFEANYLPDEARLYRLPLTAYNQMAAEGDVPTTAFVQVAAFVPESSSMEYVIPYAAVVDQDYVYRIRLHYSDEITSGWTEWEKPVRVYADRRNAPYGIKGDFTQWKTIGMTWNEQSQRYEFTVELDPETYWLWRGVFEFTVCFNGRKKYTADRTVFDSAAGLPMHEQTDADDANIYLAVSQKGMYTFTVNATNPNAPTLTVTNSLDSTDAFLVGFLGVLPQRMVDPRTGEHGGGEEDVNPPFEPYIFPSGRTLWASARISGGEWLEDVSGFYIGENGKQYGCSSVTEDQVLSLTEGQTCPVWVNPGEDTVEYDFFYCPETHQLVIRRHVTTYELILTPCDIEEGLISVSWWSVEEERHHLPNSFIVSPDAPYLPVNATVTVTAPQIPGYSFSCWYEGKANESSYSLYEEEPLSHAQTYTFEMSDFCRDVKLLAMYTRTGADIWTVAFDSMGGTMIPDAFAEDEETVQKPTDPAKIGACFGGWYTDSDCTEGNLFSFDTPVTESLTLFAKWTIPEPVGFLNLPAALTTVEADAFHGVSAEAVIIPKTVTAMEGNPFAGGSVQYIYGFNRTAQEFATANNYAFILIDDAWMASRTEKGGEGD